MTDPEFLDAVADALLALPAVEAVTLGGSRAAGTNTETSDWDLAIYYRGTFTPQDLRDLGWPGEVSEIGGWGGGVFNGGAWLTIHGRAVDVHYRDLASFESEWERARRGEFDIEPLMFHLAGIPTYLVVGEVANNRVLRGTLPRPAYPDALRRAAASVWSARAEDNLAYAEASHARDGRLAECAGLLLLAAVQYAHAILASRGEWTTNEKRMLERAGLRAVDDILLRLTAEPTALAPGIVALRALGRERLAG